MQTVLVFNAHRRYRIKKKLVEGYVKRVLGRRKGQVSVVFVDSHRCKSINRTFLHHNYVTDVISFTLEESSLLEGEVYVNLDRAKHQAKEYGVGFSDEVARLVIHGVLHLIGYNDMTGAERKRMRAREDEHVRRMLPDARRKEIH
jgi:probable rRNA maturation factor